MLFKSKKKIIHEEPEMPMDEDQEPMDMQKEEVKAGVEKPSLFKDNMIHIMISLGGKNKMKHKQG